MFQAGLLGDVDRHDEESTDPAGLVDVGRVEAVQAAYAVHRGEAALELALAPLQGRFDLWQSTQVGVLAEQLAHVPTRLRRHAPADLFGERAIVENQPVLDIELCDQRGQAIGDTLEVVARQRQLAVGTALFADVVAHQVPAGDPPARFDVGHQVQVDGTWGLPEFGVPRDPAVRRAVAHGPLERGQERRRARVHLVHVPLAPFLFRSRPLPAGAVGEPVAPAGIDIGDQGGQVVGDRVQQGTAAVLGACQVAQQQEQQRSQPDAGERQRDDGGQSGQGIAQGRRLQDELPFAAQQADVALGREGRSPTFAVAILQSADLEDRFIAEVARAQLQVELVAGAPADGVLHDPLPAEAGRGESTQQAPPGVHAVTRRDGIGVDRRVQQEARQAGTAPGGVAQCDQRRGGRFAAVARGFDGATAHRFRHDILPQQGAHARGIRIQQVHDHVFAAVASGMDGEGIPVARALGGEVGVALVMAHKAREPEPVHAGLARGHLQLLDECVEAVLLDVLPPFQHRGGRAHGVLVGVHVGGDGSGDGVGAGVELGARMIAGLPPGGGTGPQRQQAGGDQHAPRQRVQVPLTSSCRGDRSTQRTQFRCPVRA